jgi:protein ImuA
MATKFPSPAGSGSDRRSALVRELRERLGRSATVAVESLAEEEAEGDAGPRTFSSGVAAVDRLLPGGGLRHGMLVEWLAERTGCGAATLGLLAAREACRAGGVMVVLDRTRAFYPPAAAGWGVDPARLIVVRPRTTRDEIWAAVQSLRSPVVAAVWAMIDRLDSRNFRRLQLAAEAGGTLGVLVRGASARGQPSWADVRLGVKTRQGDWETRRQGERNGKRISLSPPLLVSLSGPRSVQISLLHARGGRSGGSVWIEIDEAAHEVREVRKVVTQHDPHPLPVVAELADPAARPHPARA